MSSRAQHTRAPNFTTDYVRTGGVNGNNALLSLSPSFSVPAPDVVTMVYDPSGRMSSRSITPGANPTQTSTERYTYGYHGQVVGLRSEYPGLAEVICPVGVLPNEPVAATFSEDQEVWTYRYGPDGVREQRRLQQSPKHDSSNCDGVMPWTYYINDLSGNVLAVYHGRQVNRPVITGCAAPLTVINPLERRVYMYPVEYRSYGPDGVSVIFERDNNGIMVKRFITTDYQGSVVLAQDAGDAHYKYTPFGEPLTQENIRRTGYLDRETDWESSPLVPELRTLNLVHRTYIPKHGTFTTPDPLWAMSVGASAYHYANHDPVNWSDPWGLSPGGAGAGGNSGENSDPTIDNPLAPRRKKKHFSIVLNPYVDLQGLWNADYLVGGGQGPEYGSWSNSEHLPITPGDVENYIASNNSKFGPVWTVPSLSTPGYSLQASVRPPERQRIEIVAPIVNVNRGPHHVDPSTIGRNIGWSNYTGPNNPMSYNGQDNYSVQPANAADFPPLGHDRRYGNLGVSGAFGMIADPRAIGADLQLIGEELAVSIHPYNTPSERVTAFVIALGVGLAVLPKTSIVLMNPYGLPFVVYWYNVSNKGVDNAPSNP